jgi:hypothetical protein
MLPPGGRVLLKDPIHPDWGRSVVKVVQYQVLLYEGAGCVLGQVLVLVGTRLLGASLESILVADTLVD